MFGRREKTIEKFQNFLKNGLKLNPNEIKFSDIHRLPQQPITKNGRPVHQPIIVKLLTIYDKNLIFKSARNLGPYNAGVAKLFGPWATSAAAGPLKGRMRRDSPK